MRNLGFALLVVVAACGHDIAPTPAMDSRGPSLTDQDPLGGLPTGTTEWSAVCAQHYGDIISAKFCAGTTPPVLTSLADLEALLGLTVVANPNNDPTLNQNVKITMLSESEGIGTRHTTAINPRAFLMTPATTIGGGKYQVLAFSRGEPYVELVANDPVAQTCGSSSCGFIRRASRTARTGTC